MEMEIILGIVIVGIIVYLYIGYTICSSIRTMGQAGKEIAAFINRCKEYNFEKGVSMREIQAKKSAFIKCALCAPIEWAVERLRPKKSKKRVAVRHR